MKKKTNNVTYEQLPKLFKDAAELLYKKTQDYNSHRLDEKDFNLDDARVEYFPFSDQSYMHMLHTKHMRLMSLINSDKEPNFEGIQDTLIDLVNYAGFYYTYLEEKTS